MVERREGQRLALFFALGLAVLILLLTLWPLPEFAYRASLSPVSCLVCGDQGLQDVIQNLLMFLPLGVALRCAGLRPPRALLLGFGLSLFVETMQYFVIPGRDASLSDLVTNSMGAWLGATITPLIPMAFRPSPRQGAAFGVAAAVSWALLWIFGAWAVGDDAGRANLRGRFPNEMEDAPALNGDAVEASFNGVALTSGVTQITPEAIAAYQRDEFVIDATIRPGLPVAWRENILTIIDSRPADPTFNSGVVVMLNRVTKWPLVNFRINASRLRLRTPSFRMAPLFDVPPGTEVRFRIERDGGLLSGVREGADSTLRVYRLAPELLYSIVAPRSPSTSLRWKLESFLWAAIMLGLAGWWSARSGSMVVPLLTLLLAVVVQLAVPRVFPVAPQSLLGWGMMMGGWGIGTALGVRTEKGEGRREKG